MLFRAEQRFSWRDQVTWDWQEGAESEGVKTDGRRAGRNKEDADMNNSVVITASPLKLPLSCPAIPKQEKSFKALNQSNES